ncbi:MAG: response regulator transcription factor [Bacteriovoracaceae bacterium]|nr:response regulator transcription factor [Bacteriovoracaceae bacterium]
MQKTLVRFYDDLPLGILVFSQDYSNVLFQNRTYVNLFGADETNISDNEFHSVFVEGCRKNRNKDLGTIRFVSEEDGQILLFEVFVSELKISSNSLWVYSLIPIKNREKLHKSLTRESYIFDDLRVNIPNQLVKYRGKTVDFSATEFKLFSFLCKNEDQLFSKDVLLKEIWSKSAQNTRTVDIYISRVKKRLKESGCKVEYVKTMHGRGYIFQINS